VVCSLCCWVFVVLVLLCMWVFGVFLGFVSVVFFWFLGFLWFGGSFFGCFILLCFCCFFGVVLLVFELCLG